MKARALFAVERLIQIEDSDRELLAGIAFVNAEAARRSGEWLVCRPGCAQCCVGAFGITALDALRLRNGLRELAAVEPERANRVLGRARDYVAATASIYPGDPATGALEDEDLLPPEMDEMPCPALDRETGCCDLYAARPITCRTFGPAVKTTADSVGCCELCYEGASEQEIAGCAVEFDPHGRENVLIGALEADGITGMTTVAFALATAEPLFPDRFPPTNRER